MADEDIDDEDDEDEDGEGEGEGEGEESSGGKKKLLLIIGLVILLVVGGAGAAFFTGLLDPLLKPDEEKAEGDKGGEGGEPQAATVSSAAVFYDLPEMLVNLNAGTRRAAFLKIRVSLELEKQEDIETIRLLLPRVIDNFQVYLRELRIDDLKGSAGMYRLREELLTRVNTAAAPARVNSVLFKEMLVQ